MNPSWFMVFCGINFEVRLFLFCFRRGPSSYQDSSYKQQDIGGYGYSPSRSGTYTGSSESRTGQGLSRSGAYQQIATQFGRGTETTYTTTTTMSSQIIQKAAATSQSNMVSCIKYYVACFKLIYLAFKSCK